MKIGLNMDSFGALSLEASLDRVASLRLQTVEFGLGGWSSAPHVNAALLHSSQNERARLIDAVRDRGLEISALNCSGNPLHPGEIGPKDTALAYATVEIASAMGVSRIVMMSGLPGGPGDANPNWITSSWPLEAMEILEWQWSERVLPFWRAFATHCEKHGVRACIEQHGRQWVYNNESFFRLREAVGEAVGVNFDPSHLMWMGGDPVSAIRALGDAIYHVHGKDTRIEPQARIDGLIDVKHVTPVEGRSWNYVALGHGHSVREWFEIVKALREAGYDDTISIENEDYSLEADVAVSNSAAVLKFCCEQLTR